jgi:hypothetical protein
MPALQAATTTSKRAHATAGRPPRPPRSGKRRSAKNDRSGVNDQAGMNDQVVELANPGLHILVFSPEVLADLDNGGDYARHFPDGKDLVDYVNECRMAAIGVRWPQAEYWLHFSSTMDHSVIRRASDHVRLGIEVRGGQLSVRAGDDLFRWSKRCPDDQLVSLDDGFYEMTACMMPEEDARSLRIYLHLAQRAARPELGYQYVPELFGEPPVL